MDIGLFFSLIARYFFIYLKVKGTNSFPPPLSAAEEREYFVKMSRGDDSARNKLIEHNLRLVAHIVRKYYSSAKEQDDLVSIGTIGLIKAIDSYKYDSGTKFATYAGKCLQNEILMYFRSQKKLSQEVSINETIDIDKDGNPLTYIDIISVDDTISDDLDIKMNSQKVSRIINNCLDKREKEIIVLRYGLSGGKPLTQREVAAKLGISRSYVSRIEKKAIDDIRRRLT
jgi:RNA polymerase sporulation-specific sigma factor